MGYIILMERSFIAQPFGLIAARLVRKWREVAFLGRNLPQSITARRAGEAQIKMAEAEQVSVLGVVYVVAEHLCGLPNAAVVQLKADDFNCDPPRNVAQLFRLPIAKIETIGEALKIGFDATKFFLPHADSPSVWPREYSPNKSVSSSPIWPSERRCWTVFAPTRFPLTHWRCPAASRMMRSPFRILARYRSAVFRMLLETFGASSASTIVINPLALENAANLFDRKAEGCGKTGAGGAGAAAQGAGDQLALLLENCGGFLARHLPPPNSNEPAHNRPSYEGCDDPEGYCRGHGRPPPAGLLVPPASATLGLSEPSGDCDGVERRCPRRNVRASAANVRYIRDSTEPRERADGQRASCPWGSPVRNGADAGDCRW